MLEETRHRLSRKVASLKNEDLYRTFVPIARQAGAYPKAKTRFGDRDPQFVTVWCTNDYLGMGQNEVLIRAMVDATRAFGIGSGGSRNIGGTTPLHIDLETELASLHRKEAALLFSTGYASNEASLPPGNVAAALAAVRLLRKSDVEREALHVKSKLLHGLLQDRGIPVTSRDTHIVPVVIGDSARCKTVASKLLTDFGIYVQPVNFPSVPKGTARLRVTPTPVHDDAEIRGFFDALASVLDEERVLAA